MSRRTIGLVLVILGIVGLLAFPVYAGLALVRSTGPYGPDYSQTPSGQQLSFDEAVARFQNYVSATGDKGLAVMEVMEFDNNFYAIIYEENTGVGAFELLIWKGTPRYGMMGGGMMGGGMGMGGGMRAGVVVPEPGPNMMWNTKYSMMRGMMGSPSGTAASGQMSISEQDAKSIAETFLSENFLGAHVEGGTRFYGYYTFDFDKDGKIIGMLSVNGYTGDVWYHSWHGTFIRETELA